jgi:mannonate dehydratase
MERRDFGRTMFGAAALAPQSTAQQAKVTPATKATGRPWGPGIKISVQLPTDPSDEDLQFVQQVGATYVNIPTKGETATAENFIRLKNRVESKGLRVWNIGNSDVHNMEEVTLNLPGRDKKVEQYKQYLRNLGKAGIRYTTYAHMGNGIWTTSREANTRGGAKAREFDLAKADKGYWGGKEFNVPLSHGRVFSEQEIWDNYTYFIRQVAPVAEEQGVFIGIHPDDPPVPMLAGVPRCIFGNFEGTKRALEIADSPNVGLCFCVGTWLEGGELMGADVVTAIRYFGERQKIWKVHFRNTSAPLPHFVETFVDNGYYDMYRAMKALREVNFDGVIIGDHFPQMVGGPRVSVAYTVAWMRAMAQRAEAEVGSGARSA